MYIEHIALNVPDPAATAKWYSEHLDMHVIRAYPEPPYIHFIADKEGKGVLEIYANPDAPIPDYPTMPPLMLHIAFVVDDIHAKREELLAAGATAEGEIAANAVGDQLVFLRDPWGVPLQLVKRVTALL